MPLGYESLVTRAYNALAKKELQQVINIAQILVHQYPLGPDGYSLQAHAAKANSQPNIAITLFTKALDLAPTRYDIAIELAEQLVITKQNGAAFELINEYESKLTNSPKYLNSAASSLVGIGMVEQAIPLFTRALELQPEIQLFKANLASALVYAGRIDEARQLYHELLTSNPNHQRNHYQLARITRAKDFGHVKSMQNCLSEQNLSDEQNIFLHFALGKELEDLEQWDDAFFHYKKGGDAATRASTYDLSEDLELLSIAQESYTSRKNTYEKATPIIETDPTPIFIVGLPRTGSTLLERMLSGHSNIESIGETQFLPVSIRLHSGVKDNRQLTPAMIAGATFANPQKIRDEYLSRNRYRLGKSKYFIEKLPYNALFIGIIERAFPDCKVILVQRNPIDSCFSMYKQVFTWAYKYSYDLENLGVYYGAFRSLMEYWKRNTETQIHTVNYENLVSQPKETIDNALSFLGLAFEPACIAPESNGTPSMTASSVQIRDKIHTSRLHKWKKFESHLQPLIETLKKQGNLAKSI